MKAAVAVFVGAAVFFVLVLLGVVRAGPSSAPPAPIEVRLSAAVAATTRPSNVGGASVPGRVGGKVVAVTAPSRKRGRP